MKLVGGFGGSTTQENKSGDCKSMGVKPSDFMAWSGYSGDPTGHSLKKLNIQLKLLQLNLQMYPQLVESGKLSVFFSPVEVSFSRD